jgi:aryl-phospho-beta-D-glucosidase BglC (GH1 family)
VNKEHVNTMKYNQNILTQKLRIAEMGAKQLCNPKSYALLIALAVLTGTLFSMPAISSLMSNVTIRSSGTIVTTISPLHVEGKYIKNGLNQTVFLRGVNKVEFADDPDGVWMGSTMWSDANVKAELDAMKSWGINVIRCHFSIELWKYDIGPNSGHPASPYCRISAREAMKRLAQFAAEKGMYVIYDPYTVRCYYTGADQDLLPFPPYQKSTNASDLIANVTEFVDFWRSVASELKSYPNVIFEIWNEPGNTGSSNRTNEEAFMDWMNAWNLCVDAIRDEGATQPIIFQWAMGIYCNLYENEETGEVHAGGGISGSLRLQHWMENAIDHLTDPLDNIIYSTHTYRLYGGTGLYQFSARDKYGYRGWPYDHVKMAYEYMGFKWVGDTLNKPLFIGEVGCDLAFTDEEYVREIAAWNNTLSLFNEWGLSYTAFWWRSTGVFRLHTGAPNFSPNEAGQILKIYLSGSQQGE